MENHDSPSPFAPVPTKLRHACPEPIRRDGWTVARQARFLNALAATHSVTRAARAVRMSRESAHRLRKRDPHGLFAAMWAQCFALPPTARDLAKIDEDHRRAIARASIPLLMRHPAIRETPSTW